MAENRVLGGSTVESAEDLVGTGGFRGFRGFRGYNSGTDPTGLRVLKPSQQNIVVERWERYCRSPCEICGSGHCGMKLDRVDQPHIHRCGVCYKAFRQNQ